MDPKIKNRSRLFYQMANIEVSENKGKNNMALLLDTDGYIAEGTGWNIFLVKNNELVTPEGRNILRGTRRKYIFELAKELHIKCSEKNLELYDLFDADEAFITGTPFCILPSNKINGTNISNKIIGKITKQLIDKWSDNVNLDIIAQMEDYEKEITNKGTIKNTTTYQFRK